MLTGLKFLLPTLHDGKRRKRGENFRLRPALKNAPLVEGEQGNEWTWSESYIKSFLNIGEWEKWLEGGGFDVPASSYSPRFTLL